MCVRNLSHDPSPFFSVQKTSVCMNGENTEIVYVYPFPPDFFLSMIFFFRSHDIAYKNIFSHFSFLSH